MSKLEARERIISAAKAEFSKHGFAGARMESIAKVAKINKAMLYYYYGSKKNLYVNLLKSLFSQGSKSEAFRELSELNLTAPEKLYAVICFLVHLHCNIIDKETHQIIAWEMAEGRTHLKLLAKDYLIPRVKFLESIIKEGVDNGDFETADPLLSVIDLLFFITVYNMHRETYEGSEIYDALYGNKSDETMIQFVSEKMFKALSPDGGYKIPQVNEEILKRVLSSNESLSRLTRE